MKRVIVRVTVAGLALVSGGAFAQSSCTSILSSYESGFSPNAPVNHPECFGSTAATSTTSINATAFSQAAAISGALSARSSGASGGPVALSAFGYEKGMAAGSKNAQWNVWGSAENNETRYGYLNTNNANVDGSNRVRTFVVGADYALSPQMVIGLSAAFDDGKASGTSAAGTVSSGTDGYLLSPYLGYQFNKELALDIAAGFGAGKFANANGLTADADRWFAATNLTYNRWMGNLQLQGKASYLHGEEDYAHSKNNGVTVANTKSKNTLDQIRLGVQAAYWMNGIMPYAGLGYSSNVSRKSDLGSDPLGRDTFVATLGLNFFSLSSKVSGGLLYSQELNREHSKNQIVSGNVNFRF